MCCGHKPENVMDHSGTNDPTRDFPDEVRMMLQPKPKRHPSSERFHELLELAGKLHDVKQGDYGKGDDPFANVRAASEWGIPAWVGCMIRATDKIRRLQTMATKGILKNESVQDSFLDLAVYALIGYILFEETINR